SGVALTTGAAALISTPNAANHCANAGIPGPNNCVAAGIDNGAAGNANLTALAGAQTYDAAMLQFSFIPTGNQVSFEYVFGSEEYAELTDWYFNDPFAFYRNGVNIAVIPGTNTPVNAGTINLDNYSQYYVDCPAGTTNCDTQYDGLAGAATGFPLFAT